jgi:N-acylneuraminate cytidylyltransferase/CMP-N,N'-diacetyllegionaminic acid synthase
LFDAIAVSSDSARILEVAREWGADYLVERPVDMATDTAPKVPAIRHCVAEVERLSGTAYDTLVDLDATSPLRVPADIVGAVAVLEREGGGNVITGAPARRSPYFNLVEVGADGVARLSKHLPVAVVRRHDAPRCYDMNASIYAWAREMLFGFDGVFGPRTRLYEMPTERSLDIDSELDLEVVEFIMKKRAAP